MTDSNQTKSNQPIQNKQYWQEQIKLKRESGLSRAAYCKKHDLSYHTFAYWATGDGKGGKLATCSVFIFAPVINR